MKKPKKRTVQRSSKTGQFVTKKFAARHPATTETQRVREPERKNAK